MVVQIGSKIKTEDTTINKVYAENEIKSKRKEHSDELKKQIIEDYNINRLKVNEILKKYKIGKQMLFKYVKKNRQSILTEEIKLKILQLYANNFSTSEIGKFYNCSESRIYKIIKDLGKIKSRSETRLCYLEKGHNCVRSKKTTIMFKGKSIRTDSTYELARILMWLNSPYIKNISRCNERIEYTLDNKKRLYNPDFLIEDINKDKIAEEIKASWRRFSPEVINKERAAIKYFKTKNIQYKIITEKDISDFYLYLANIIHDRFKNEIVSEEVINIISEEIFDEYTKEDENCDVNYNTKIYNKSKILIIQHCIRHKVIINQEALDLATAFYIEGGDMIKSIYYANKINKI